jgi:hypothetical protein
VQADKPLKIVTKWLRKFTGFTSPRMNRLPLNTNSTRKLARVEQRYGRLFERAGLKRRSYRPL